MNPPVRKGRWTTDLATPLGKEIWVFDETQDQYKGIPGHALCYGSAKEGVPIIPDILCHLRKDDVERFLECARDGERIAIASVNGFVITAPILLEWAMIHGALRCAEALLRGELGEPVDLTTCLNMYQLEPLHHAAVYFMPEAAELLIKYGASLDWRSRAPGRPYYGITPLEALLKALRWCNWYPFDGMEGLISFIFNRVSEERVRALHTLTCLLRALPIEQIERTMHQKAKHENFFDLAAIMYVDTFYDLRISQRLGCENYGLLKPSVTNTLSDETVESLSMLLHFFKEIVMVGIDYELSIVRKMARNVFTKHQNLSDVHESDVIERPMKVFELPAINITERTNHSGGIWPLGFVSRPVLKMEIGQVRLPFSSNRNRNYRVQPLQTSRQYAAVVPSSTVKMAAKAWPFGSLVLRKMMHA